MKLQEIRAIAKHHHIHFSGLSKSELIQEIQRKEGNFDCYGTACSGECSQMGLWRGDCFDAATA